MFGIKKRGRKISAKVFNQTSRGLSGYFGKWSAGWRIQGRLKLFSRWGKRHPKRLCIYYVAFALVILSVNILFSIISLSHPNTDQDSLGLSQIVNSSPVSGMTQININREVINATIDEYASTSLLLASRLDSLNNIKEKSREDSIEMVSIYQKLIKHSKPISNESETN